MVAYPVDAPLMLYGVGECDLNSAHILSIVGTRNATSYGIGFTQKLVEDLANKIDNLVIISGLAYGIDIAANPNESVLATLDGTVILATYTADTGYVIQVQHAQNLVSVYKHCGSLLKKVGDTVKAGEAIALVGNTGEKTTGPHLHFEIWNRGRALDPSNYIVF